MSKRASDSLTNQIPRALQLCEHPAADHRHQRQDGSLAAITVNAGDIKAGTLSDPNSAKRMSSAARPASSAHTNIPAAASRDGPGTDQHRDVSISRYRLRARVKWKGHEHFVVVFAIDL